MSGNPDAGGLLISGLNPPPDPSQSIPHSDMRRALVPERSADYNSISAASALNLTSRNSLESNNLTNNANVSGLPQQTSTHDKAPLLNVNARLLKSLSGVGNSDFFESIKHDGLSTFSGVFCPVALSMFSVLLFLRMGFVVGQSGVLLTVGQLIIAYLIISFTVLSLCAVSTNGAIEGGGVYYMISRALGPEFGGSIGILFFIANVFSCGLYVAGFTEVIINNFGPGGYIAGNLLPNGRWWTFFYEFIVVGVVLALCMVGAAMFARFSLGVLVVFAVTYISFLISLMVNHSAMSVKIPKENNFVYSDTNISFHNDTTVFGNYTGPRTSTLRDNMYPDYNIDYTTMHKADFAIVFAVIFSGVTGIMAGANMSGELKRPSMSIPRGTLQAVAVTFCTYFVTTFLLGSSCSRFLLQNDYIVTQDINIWPPFIAIGVGATTLCSALSNLIGASRVLTRLADDRLFGSLLTVASLKICKNNPVYSVLISWVLVVCVLLMGTLNRIAQITSIFFLLSYAGVNLACLALELSSAPNFRPAFRYFTWHTAFLGVVGSVSMMFVVDPVFTGVACICLLILLMVLHYVAPMATWGSISQALIFHQVRKFLLLLDSRKDHVKYWRPQILLLINNPKSGCALIDFVNDIKKSGLYIIGHVKRGRYEDYPMDPILEDMPFWLGLIDHLRIKAFVELTVAPSVREGVQHLSRLSGIGAMKPNTVFIGFYDEQAPSDLFQSQHLLRSVKFSKLDSCEIVDKFTAMKDATGEGRSLTADDYVHIIHDLLRMNKNVCIVRGFESFDKQLLWRSKFRTYIDVWPIDMQRPGSLSWNFDTSCLFLMQMACILNMVRGWRRKTTVRIFLTVTSQQDIMHRENVVRQILSQLRITAKTVMIPWDHVLCHLPDGAGAAADKPIDFATVPESYVIALNELLRRHRDAASSLSFLSLPLPPADDVLFEQYVQRLHALTDGLPPTVLVHGISSVISTAL